jgi:hypothetical protein
MPKGHHYGRTQKRAYTGEYHRISTKIFKNLLTVPLGNYSLNVDFLSNTHQKFKLTTLEYSARLMTFTINDKPHKIVTWSTKFSQPS